ncbi:exported hypothetical protein [Mesorhizobium sp. STM 4661]|nr:exported hypothetical protein [Mesorhizobium sp. STM 4661]
MTSSHNGNRARLNKCWGDSVTISRRIRRVVAVSALGASLLLSPNAYAKSAAYQGGYIMAAYFSCPNAYAYSSMNNFFKYQGTKEYDRGYAAFLAELKGPRPSKVCFDAARASGFFTVR